jgi:hypothetical protein
MAPMPAIAFIAIVYLALAVLVTVFGYEVYALLGERGSGGVDGPP